MNPFENKTKQVCDNLFGMTGRLFFHTNKRRPLGGFHLYSPIKSASDFGYRLLSPVAAPLFFSCATISLVVISILKAISVLFQSMSVLYSVAIKREQALDKKLKLKNSANDLGHTVLLGVYSFFAAHVSEIINLIDLIACTLIALGKGVHKFFSKTFPDSNKPEPEVEEFNLAMAI